MSRASEKLECAQALVALERIQKDYERISDSRDKQILYALEKGASLREVAAAAGMAWGSIKYRSDKAKAAS